MMNGIPEAKAALLPWLKERAKDNAILSEGLFVTLAMVDTNANRSIFSDRLDVDAHTNVGEFVDLLLQEAADACASRPGRTMFIVAIRGDSRIKRFVLLTNVGEDDEDGALVQSDVVIDTAPDGKRTPFTEAMVDRVLWALWAAAAVANTAEFTKPTYEDKPTKATNTGGKVTVTSRDAKMIAADSIAHYAARIADEMLKKYRERWRKR